MYESIYLQREGIKLSLKYIGTKKYLNIAPLGTFTSKHKLPAMETKKNLHFVLLLSHQI